jgi:hypothetical protein
MTGDQDVAGPPKELWPGVPRAYDFVLPSYTWMNARLEAADSRIQTLMTFMSSITLAVPAAAHMVRGNITFGSRWFLGGISAFVLSMVLGLATRAWGGLTFTAPGVLYDKWLHLSESEFKRRAVYWAGQHFDRNVAVVNGKGRIVTVMSALFLIETLLLITWLAT